MSLACSFAQVTVNELDILRIRMLERRERKAREAAEGTARETLGQKFSRWTGIRFITEEEHEVMKKQWDDEAAKQLALQEAKRQSEGTKK
jgi:hypothetical protein